MRSKAHKQFDYGVQEVEYLGHIVYHGGINVDPKN